MCLLLEKGGMPMMKMFLLRDERVEGDDDWQSEDEGVEKVYHGRGRCMVN